MSLMPPIANNDRVCIICREELFPQNRHGEPRTDKTWDEARCFPHNDPEKLHITLRMLFDCAVNYGAPKPHRVAQSVALILWYEYEAPDDTPEAGMIDAAVDLLWGSGVRL